MRIAGSPFGEIGDDRVLWESDAALAFLDGFPLADGHTLLVPRRVVASLRDLTEDEEAELWKPLRKLRGLLAERYRPAGFNIGINFALIRPPPSATYAMTVEIGGSE